MPLRWSWKQPVLRPQPGLLLGYVLGELAYEEMFRGLETAIHQFAKRQMTWFRGMERRGIKINWLDAGWPMEKKIGQIQDWLCP